ncbi:MAG: patatin-like phospholipase family protein [Leptospirales bacterium]|nr:patatin-like phospholipase family protein [Leptospirales bacterium]
MGWPFRNIVFEGGGVWGAAYGGALLKLEEQGILAQMERAAGTSAGSIAALTVSLRYNAHQMRKLLRDLDFSSFTQKSEPLKFHDRYGWYTTGALLDWIQQLIREAGPNLGRDLTGQETFADLKAAGALDLVVFAADLNRRRSIAFSAQNTPAVPVAEAVRASASIPGFFQACELKVNEERAHIFVDGGILINYPIMAFDRNRPNRATLGLKFTRRRQQPDAPAADFSFGMWSQWARQLYDTISNQRNEILYRTPIYLRRTIFIDVGEASAVNFAISDWEKNELMERGYQGVERFVHRWQTEHSPLGLLRRLFGWRPERKEAGL